MCEGLTKAGVTKLDVMEQEIIAFAKRIILSPQISARNLRRHTVFRRRMQYQMTWLQGAAIHMYTVDRADHIVAVIHSPFSELTFCCRNFLCACSWGIGWTLKKAFTELLTRFVRLLHFHPCKSRTCASLNWVFTGTFLSRLGKVDTGGSLLASFHGWSENA